MRRKQTTTTTTALGTAAVIALVLGGCASGIQPRDDRDVDYSLDAHLTGTLDVMGFGLGDDVATVRDRDARAALGGDVRVSMAEGALDTQTFLSAVAAGDPPDLVYASRDDIGSLATQGALLPLDRCLAGSDTDTAQFRDSAVAQVSHGGHVYGVPEFNQLQIAMASTDLLDRSGLSMADVNGSDWSAMTAANEAMTRTTGKRLDVVGVDAKLPDFFWLWTLANGTRPISEDGRTAQLDDPAVVEALAHAVSLTEPEGGFDRVKAVRDAADLFGEDNPFAAGKLGAEPMDNWYVNVLEDVSPDVRLQFDAFRDRKGQPIAFAGGSAWAVPVNARDPQLACRYAVTMTSVDAWLDAAKARIREGAKTHKQFTGLLTANRTADARIERLALDQASAQGRSSDDQWVQAVRAIYTANDRAVSAPANPAAAEFAKAWQDGVNSVLNGQDTPERAMARAQQVAQRALDDAWAEEGRR
ncbi:ABC transporter substrate-binding protein [Curtobacterium sp. MCBA15_008]|uniref:ABC transporter substrate-binding protein n=1 Tax=Curtobacterium sp. MCBA15_008 TaxID=1898736 RepID=UPI0008DD5DD5|nr:extracellular solute-binding protein [Curtobacterium sp. MCBA15_008]OII12467.1 ABC transporter substrate-binding protein [Curtobacterium sp. MCBA15_008]